MGTQGPGGATWTLAAPSWAVCPGLPRRLEATEEGVSDPPQGGLAQEPRPPRPEQALRSGRRARQRWRQASCLQALLPPGQGCQGGAPGKSGGQGWPPAAGGAPASGKAPPREACSGSRASGRGRGWCLSRAPCPQGQGGAPAALPLSCSRTSTAAAQPVSRRALGPLPWGRPPPHRDSAVGCGFSSHQGLGVPATGGGSRHPRGGRGCAAVIAHRGRRARQVDMRVPSASAPAWWGRGSPPNAMGCCSPPGVPWTSAQVAEVWGPGRSPEGPTHCGGPRPRPSRCLGPGRPDLCCVVGGTDTET